MADVPDHLTSCVNVIMDLKAMTVPRLFAKCLVLIMSIVIPKDLSLSASVKLDGQGLTVQLNSVLMTVLAKESARMENVSVTLVTQESLVLSNNVLRTVHPMDCVKMVFASVSKAF